ncbi:hypothetical protein EGI32_21120 [Ferruginibacter sp. HRS2-29]|nr:hypothetical protein [Ferruginibacter sp. HRS2-29]
MLNLWNFTQNSSLRLYVHAIRRYKVIKTDVLILKELRLIFENMPVKNRRPKEQMIFLPVKTAWGQTGLLSYSN